MIIIKLIGTGDKYIWSYNTSRVRDLFNYHNINNMERLILQSDWDEVLKYAYFETSWEMLRFLSFLRKLFSLWLIWSIFPWIVYLQSYFHFYNSVECGWISNSLNHSILYSSDRAPDYKGLDLISHIFYYFAKSRRTAFWTYWF